LRPDKVSPAISGLEAGIVCAPVTVGSAPAPDTLAGATHIIDEEPPFVSVSRRVPAVIGIGFGVKSTASTKSGIDDVLVVITHPPMGADQIRTQSFLTAISGIESSLTFYQFDSDYELVPGLWQMAATKDGQPLFSAMFEVVAPQQAPQLAAACGFEELLS